MTMASLFTLHGLATPGILLAASEEYGNPSTHSLAATAGYLSHQPRVVIPLGVAIAIAETWAGITLAYYNKAPVSFFIAAMSMVAVAANPVRPLVLVPMRWIE